MAFDNINKLMQSYNNNENNNEIKFNQLDSMMKEFKVNTTPNSRISADKMPSMNQPIDDRTEEEKEQTSLKGLLNRSVDFVKSKLTTDDNNESEIMNQYRDSQKEPEYDTVSSAQQDVNLDSLADGMQNYYYTTITSFLSDFTGESKENVASGAGLDGLPTTGNETADKSAEFIGSLGASLGHLALAKTGLTGIGTAAKVASPGLDIAYQQLPNLVKGSLGLGSLWSGRKAIQTEVQGEQHQPKDYVETFLTGAAAAPAGMAAGSLIREAAVEGLVPDSIYPLVSGVGSGLTKGAAMTGVQKAFDDDTGLEDLGLNMATMAIWNTIPAITNYKEMQNNVKAIRQIRDLGTKAIDKYGIIKPKDIKSTKMAKEDIKSIEASILASTASNKYKNLSSSQQNQLNNQLAKVWVGAEYADKYIANMPLSDKAKIVANSSFKDILTNSLSDLFSTTMGTNITIDATNINTTADTGKSGTPLLTAPPKLQAGKSFSQRPALEEGAALLDTTADVPLLEGQAEPGGIDIQHSTPQDLMNIKGLGVSLSERIAEFAQNNEINKPEDLLNIKGVGESTLEKIDITKIDFSQPLEQPQTSEDSLETQADLEQATEEGQTTEQPQAPVEDIETTKEVDTTTEPATETEQSTLAEQYDIDVKEAISKIDRMLDEGVDYDPLELEKANDAGEEQTSDQKELILDVAFNDHQLSQEQITKLKDKRQELQQQVETEETNVEQVEETEQTKTTQETTESVEDTTETEKVSDDYFVIKDFHKDKDTEVVKVNNAEPVDIQGLEEFDTFIYLNEKGNWEAAEGRSGTQLAEEASKEKLISKLNEISNEISPEDFRQRVNQKVEWTSGTPRYNQNIEVTRSMEERTTDTTKTTEVATKVEQVRNYEVDDWKSVKGIGDATAQHIKGFINNVGIESLDDLLEVKGIGQATLDNIKSNLNIEDTTTETETVEETEEDTAENTGLDTEPTAEELQTEDVSTETDDLDVDEVASEVDEVEGSTETINELVSEEARDLLELEGKDIRETLDIVYYTTLEELQNLSEGERARFIEGIREDDPDVADAIEAEIEERDLELGDISFSKGNESISSDELDGSSQNVDYTTRKEIEDLIRVDLSLPLRYGKLDSRDAEAQYDRGFEEIRTRDYSNMEVTAHEVGHHLSNKLDLEVGLFPELETLLKDEGMAEYYPKEVWAEEGNSEFFKYYFNYPGNAKVKIPAYYEYVESKLRESDMYDAVKQLQKKMSDWQQLSPDQKVSGAMSREGLETPRTLSLRDRIYKKLVDDNILLPKIYERFGIDRDELGVLDDPYQLMRLYDSINDTVNQFMKNHQLDWNNVPNGKPLIKILKPVENDIGETENREFGDFEVYLLAKHGVEREGRILERHLRAMDNDTANILSSQLDEAIENGDTQTIANIVKEVENNQPIAQMLGFGEGYKAQGTGMEINDMIETVNEYESEKFLQAAKELQDYQNNLLDRAEHFGLMSQEQVENIKNSYSFHIPLRRHFGEELSNPPQPASRYTNLPDAVKNAYGSTRIIKDFLQGIVQDTNYIVRQAAKNDVVLTLFEGLEGNEGIGEVIGREEEAGQGSTKENYVTYFKKGERKGRVVSPELYEFLQGMDKNTALNLVNLTKYLKPSNWGNSNPEELLNPANWLYTINGMFKQFAVINPMFWIRNLGRDEFRELIFSRNGLKKVMLFSSVLDGMSQQFGMSREEIDSMFRGMGGARGGFASYLKDIDSPDTIEKLLASDKISKNPIVWAGDAAQWTEDTRRKGFFVEKAKELLNGRSFEDLSKEEAREILAESALFGKGGILEDYSIRGEWTRGFDRLIAPFSSAGVTGARHLYNKMKEPSTWIAAILSIITPTLALWNINKDNPEYQELTTVRKMMYWNIPKPNGGFIPIIKPFLPGYVFGGIPEMVANYKYTQDKEELKEGAWTVFQAGMPNMQPSGILPYLEVYSNRRNMLSPDNSPIVHESEQGLPTSQQYGNYTSELGKLIGKTGIASPRKIDHLLRGQFTGSATGVMEFSNYIAGAQSFKETTMSILGLYMEPFATSNTVNKLYEDREKYQNELSNIRERVMVGEDVDFNDPELEEKAIKSTQINRITDLMNKRRKVSTIIDTLDIDQNLKDNAKLYLNTQNISDAREFYDKSRINLANYMEREEYQRVQELINWIESNY